MTAISNFHRKHFSHARTLEVPRSSIATIQKMKCLGKQPINQNVQMPLDALKRLDRTYQILTTSDYAVHAMGMCISLVTNPLAAFLGSLTSAVANNISGSVPGSRSLPHLIVNDEKTVTISARWLKEAKNITVQKILSLVPTILALGCLFFAPSSWFNPVIPFVLGYLGTDSITRLAYRLIL